jgi:hypothetical protein
MVEAFAIHQEEKECLYEMVIVIEASFTVKASFALEIAIVMPSIRFKSSVIEACIIASFVNEASSAFASYLASASLVVPSSLAALIGHEEFMEKLFIAEDKEVSIESNLSFEKLIFGSSCLYF